MNDFIFNIESECLIVKSEIFPAQKYRTFDLSRLFKNCQKYASPYGRFLQAHFPKNSQPLHTFLCNSQLLEQLSEIDRKFAQFEHRSPYPRPHKRKRSSRNDAPYFSLLQTPYPSIHAYRYR